MAKARITAPSNHRSESIFLGIICIRERWGSVVGNHEGMNQLSLMTEFERGTKRTVKQVFLEEMLAVVPWDALVALVTLVTPHQSVGGMGTLHALVSIILCKYALSPEEQTMKTQETALKGFPDPSLSIQPVPVESLDLTGRRVVVSGGTDGLGRAIARLAASRGAEVTVVGRTFRDEGVKGLQFVKADLSSMKEAQRVGREMAVESTDVLLLTTGIIPAVTVHGVMAG